MAEVTLCRNNALGYPTYGAPWTLVFPILDNTGALVSGAAGLDSELSGNGDTFADCTNEATEIGSSGMYYLALTAVEMSWNIVTVVVKTSTTNAKTTPIVLYPRALAIAQNGTGQGGGSGAQIVLASSASALDGFYTGMLVVSNNDGVYEARLITGYTGSTRVADVHDPWVTTPDSNDDYVVYYPDGYKIQQANTTAWNNAQVATPLVAGIPKVQPVDEGWRQP